MDYFLQRVEAVGEPFFATYLTFVGHAPYYDYGPEFRVYDDTSNPRHRYINNLRLLDRLVEKMIGKLEASGLLDSTIVVVTGDHGEAFGQHEDVWVHASSNYNEEYKVPLVIYQPALFEPRSVTKVTSHVDLLPTLLDATGASFDPALLQGESLFRDTPSRRYVFMVNHGGGISSVNNYNIKVAYSANSGSCNAYDLDADPGERNPLSCDRYSDQYDALLAFVKFQRGILPAYNSAMQEDQLPGNEATGIAGVISP